VVWRSVLRPVLGVLATGYDPGRNAGNHPGRRQVVVPRGAPCGNWPASCAALGGPPARSSLTRAPTESDGQATGNSGWFMGAPSASSVRSAPEASGKHCLDSARGDRYLIGGRARPGRRPHRPRRTLRHRLQAPRSPSGPDRGAEEAPQAVMNKEPM
jgi:hypothetical protein